MGPIHSLNQYKIPSVSTKCCFLSFGRQGVFHTLLKSVQNLVFPSFRLEGRGGVFMHSLNEYKMLPLFFLFLEGGWNSYLPLVSTECSFLFLEGGVKRKVRTKSCRFSCFLFCGRGVGFFASQVVTRRAIAEA